MYKQKEEKIFYNFQKEALFSKCLYRFGTELISYSLNQDKKNYKLVFKRSEHFSNFKGLLTCIQEQDSKIIAQINSEDFNFIYDI